MRYVSLLILICLAFTTTNVQADLIITIGNASHTANGASLSTSDDPALGPFTAGTTVTIPFLAHITGLTPSPLTSYSLTVDIGGDGDGFPGSPDYFSTFSFVSGVGGSLTQAPTVGSGAGNNDYILSWIGNVNLSTNAASPSTLFTLTFDSSASTAPGFYDVLIGQDATSLALTAYSSNATPITDLQYDQGRFEVSASAVPEPGSVLALAGLMIGGGIRHWRKKKQVMGGSTVA